MSSEALAKPIVTRNSSEFKQDSYASLPTGELVVFAVQVLQAENAPVAVEEVVSICFRFFPHSFALKNYFYWPDSALVTRRLHDAREKGLLKGSPADGYETKVQGRQVAKHVAKALGVSLPVPPKVEVVVAPVVEKKEEAVTEKNPSSPLRAGEEEKKETSPSALVVITEKKQEAKKKVQKKVAKPEKKAAKKKQAARPKVQAKPKKEVVTPVKKKTAPKPKTAPKKTVKAVVKAKGPVKQKPAKVAVSKPKTQVKAKVTVPKKEPVKTAPKPKVIEKKQEALRLRSGQAKKKEAKASAQPKQLTMPLTPPTAWKKAEAPAPKPKVKKEALPVKGEVLAPVAVSKEEKDKAAKVVKQIERSDAYQLYRRNGKRAQIGEFDFRNMLFATMESSAETLKRNVELFKRYAGIHFRTDLIAFLEFCEERFSALLISKVKGRK